MMANPRKGQLVRVHYKKSLADWFPLHGKVGTVEIVCKGKPRNHGVVIDGKLYAIPCGNLNKYEKAERTAAPAVRNAWQTRAARRGRPGNRHSGQENFKQLSLFEAQVL